MGQKNASKYPANPTMQAVSHFGMPIAVNCRGLPDKKLVHREPIRKAATADSQH
jgi:hypothetical protein